MKRQDHEGIKCAANKSQMDCYYIYIYIYIYAKSSVLCSNHFVESCFEAQPKFVAQFGIAMRSGLKSSDVLSKHLCWSLSRVPFIIHFPPKSMALSCLGMNFFVLVLVVV